jgi:FkbH-like protein
LELDDFAVTRINWRPKIKNVGEIISAVNVLPSSVLFIDDNPVERASVQAAHPGIRVLGADQYYLKRILLGAPELQVAKITAEAASKTEMVRAQVKRDESRKTMSSEEFLQSLDLKVTQILVPSSEFEKFPRALELLNKTNQFNTTGKRWSQAELSSYLREGGQIVAYEAEDKFTRYGMIAVVLVSEKIDQIVMSCRVVGMDVEKIVLSTVEHRLRDQGVALISAAFVSTPSNNLCKGLFPSAGYQADLNGNYSKPSTQLLPAPAHITFSTWAPAEALAPAE